MKRILTFFRQEAVLCIACLLALLSMLFVPPDAAYAEYIDFRTLAILFSLMAVMAGLQEIGVFRWMGRTLLRRVGSMRGLILILLLLCFFSSMLMTNDVALITFVPLTFIVLKMTGEGNLRKFAVPIVVMQTIAANLGSMLTPIGNPQNLYLYGISDMALGDFLLLMLPYSAISGVLLLLWSLVFTRSSGAQVTVDFGEEEPPMHRGKLLMYAVLFVLCLLTVARVMAASILLPIIAVTLLLADRRVLCRVDYSLLLTFIGFFVFIGNMGRIPALSSFLESIISGREMLTAVLSSQVISNVPAALLLSGFTEHYRALIVGTNLGGLGTLIASMASLISFKLLSRELPGEKGRFMLHFTVYNLLFLAMLYGSSLLLPM